MEKTKSLALILGVLAMSLLLGYLVLAWTEPILAPPGGNVPAPLNVSLTAQSKEGALVIGTNSGLTTGLIVRYGNVGIGTTGPAEKLTVQSVSGGRGVINVNQIDTDNWAGLKIDRDASEKWFIGVSDADNKLRLRRDGASDDLVIDATGNVGIGTAAPNTALDINGALSARGMAVPAVSPAGQGRIYFDSGTNRFRVSENAGAYVDLVGVSNAFVQGGNSFGVLATLGTNDAFGLAFETNNTERVRIDTAGNVGIGTVTPGGLLDINDRARNQLVSAPKTWQFPTDNINRSYPAIFDVYRVTNDGLSQYPLYLDIVTGVGYNFLSDYGGGVIRFLTTPSGKGNPITAIERMRITQNGNVGIGTTNPQAKLDVAGGIRVNTSATRTRTTEGFACTDTNTNAQITGETVTCDSTHRGTIEIIKNTCSDGTIRDSLCYCGEYGTAGTYKWICLISCP